MEQRPHGRQHAGSDGGGTLCIDRLQWEGCAGLSNTVQVEVLDGSVAPSVAVEGDENLCAGSTWTLSASDGSAYLWSNGATTSTIEVGVSGSYSVSVEDQCGNAISSSEVDVVVFDGPTEAPTISPDTTLSSPGSILLTAEATGGALIQWFDAEVGGNLVAEGSDVNLPLVTESTTLWAEASQVTTGPSGTGGELAVQPGGQYHPNSARWLELSLIHI